MNHGGGPSCRRVRRALPLLLSGDVGDGDRGAQLWAHLRACASCRREFADTRTAVQALHSLRAVPDPGAVFFAELQRETLAALAAEPRRPRVSLRQLLLRAAVGCAACLVVAVAAWRWPRPRPKGSRLLYGPSLVALPTRPLASAPRWVVPASFTPSQQGLRGLQQLSGDPLEPLPPTTPGPR